MILPSVSISEKLIVGDYVEKVIACGLALGTLYANTPSHIETFTAEILSGIAHQVPVALIELASLYAILAFSSENDRNGRYHDPLEYDYRLTPPKIIFLDSDGVAPLISGPIDEEITTRGLLLPLIKMLLIRAGFISEYASVIAILASSIIFALQHDPDETVRLSPFIGGLMYGYLRENFGLFSSIAAHMTNNTLIQISATASTISPYLTGKLEQIKAVQEKHIPLPTATHDGSSNTQTTQMMLEKMRLEFENSVLDKIAHKSINKNKLIDMETEIKFENNLRKDTELLAKHNQELLEENENLRTLAFKTLSDSFVYKYIYRFFYNKPTDNKNTQIQNDNGDDKVRLFSYLNV